MEHIPRPLVFGRACGSICPAGHSPRCEGKSWPHRERASASSASASARKFMSRRSAPKAGMSRPSAAARVKRRGKPRTRPASRACIRTRWSSFAGDDLAAIAIITPPGAHHRLSIAALDAGKHVLCEKPFAIDAKQAEEMRAAANKSGRTAMIAHEFRHTPQRAHIRQLLADGYIGKFQL